jgi:hypothetical protein
VDTEYRGGVHNRWEANGTPAYDGIFSDWNTAGARLSAIGWWVHRYVNVEVEIDEVLRGTAPLTMLRYFLQGRDANGASRLARGLFVFDSIFPLTHVGLKMLESTGSGRNLIMVEAH